MSIILQLKISRKLVGTIFFMLLAFQVKANDQDTRPAELEYANKRLNEVYKQIIGKLEPSEQIKLRKSQRQWITFRDLDCAWAFGAEPLDCLIDRTDNRMKELSHTWFFDVKGSYFSIKK